MDATLPSRTSSASPAAPRWRLGRDMLVEARPDGCRLYGRWDRTFGCWEKCTGGLRVCAPETVFLGCHGRWLDPAGRRDDLWYASRAALAGYFSLIPTPIRRLVAPFGLRQWDLLARIWRAPATVRELDAAHVTKNGYAEPADTLMNLEEDAR